MKRKELADLLTIYNNDCNDYTIKLWDPVQQKNYNLVFTGSNNVDKEINFNISEVALTDIEKRRLEINTELLMLYKQQSVVNRRIKELEKM